MGGVGARASRWDAEEGQTAPSAIAPAILALSELRGHMGKAWLKHGQRMAD